MTVVHLVPHTHWDREWYLPFQTFRMRLVELVDQVLDAMEADPAFVFTLDGQLATVDDYLELRPGAETRIRALVEQGRLSIGPWQTLVDEFLVSGEAIVRNLETGWRRAEQLGGAMPVGYLPDMFGHVAQMPQILRGAGLADAVVWRGVPAAIDHHAFGWEAPDGSVVRVEYLVGGYGNAAHVLDDPERLPAAATDFHARVQPFFGDGEPLLAMLGTDHMLPHADLVARVGRLNAEQRRYRLELVTLDGYLRGVERDAGHAHWRGELRSAARANMLMGVTSARIDLKAACARAERLLERYAEPLQALFGGDWPSELLALAWARVIENGAHDSICGCSVDAVCDQVLVRFAEAEQIGGGLAQRAAERIATGVPTGSVAVVNPSPTARSGLVELELDIPAAWDQVALELPDGTLLATQEVAHVPALLYATHVAGRDVAASVFRRVHGRELFGYVLNGFSIDETANGPRITIDVGETPDPPSLDGAELKREIAAACGAGPDTIFELRIVAARLRRLQTVVPAPPLGWTSVRPVRRRGAADNQVQVGPGSLANGLVAIEVADDGTFRAGALEGIGRLVDGGDFGDTYNYAPPAVDTLVSEPTSVAVEARAEGPVRGELAIVRDYLWPVGALDDGSARTEETASVRIVTHVELHAGEPFIRVRVESRNPCEDHRLRFHVPTAVPSTSTFAEGQFAVVERGHEPEGGHGEVPLPTYPARGFVDAGGIAVLLQHVTEYELLDGRELALTLLRSTGLISRSANPFREEPAGPELAVPGAQRHGRWSVEFALYPHAGSWTEADVLAQTERYHHPFLTAAGTGTAASVATGSGLELRGQGVVLSSLRRREDWLELRLVCEQPEPREAVVSGDFREARACDLFGRAGRTLELERGALRLELGAWQIVSVQLRR